MSVPEVPKNEYCTGFQLHLLLPKTEKVLESAEFLRGLILSNRLQCSERFSYCPVFSCSKCLLRDRDLQCWVLAGESFLKEIPIQLIYSARNVEYCPQTRFCTLKRDWMWLDAAATHEGLTSEYSGDCAYPYPFQMLGEGEPFIKSHSKVLNLRSIRSP
ncbi:hypothetical protein Trydic_g9104 [Trypoxylus dichotomus]